MSEVMTSREEAAELHMAVRDMVKRLERHGFVKAQIGSAMAGIGLALVQAHDGPNIALSIIEAARNALMADLAPKH